MKALLIVDLQNDFCPGGALAVREGDRIVPLANRLQRHFDLVVATQDWHPAGHGSFAANHPGRRPGETVELAGMPQILWPVHCVQETPGADFHPKLSRARFSHIVRKGTDPAIDSYSGFFDNGRRKATGLGDYLKQQHVEEVFICGLTTDYCVRFTALDAVALGFRTHVIADACRGVNLHPGDAERALDALRAAGVRVIQSAEVLGRRHALCEGRFVRLMAAGGWEWAERTNSREAAVVMAVTTDNRVVLVEQYRIPLGKRVIELPAGLVGDEPGMAAEDLIEAARRELLEETGYESPDWQHVLEGPSSPGLTNETFNLFIARDARQVAAGGGDEGEDIEVHLVPLDGIDAWLVQKRRGGAAIDPKIYAGLYLLYSSRSA
jgi:nicotinamidase/pyrazinamidase